jgi:hypothetical protein
MSRYDGKKIDEFRFESTMIVVRYHQYSKDFEVVAGDEKFKGENVKTLVDQAKVYLKGWSKLLWTPVIIVDTEPGRDIGISYERLFKSKHKGAAVYRRWIVDGENEGQFGRWHLSEKNSGDVLEGEPGIIDQGPRGLYRELPYIPERWTAIRALDRGIRAAVETAEIRLSKIFADAAIDKVDTFLSSVRNEGLSLMWKEQ